MTKVTQFSVIVEGRPEWCDPEAAAALAQATAHQLAQAAQTLADQLGTRAPVRVVVREDCPEAPTLVARPLAATA